MLDTVEKFGFNDVGIRIPSGVAVSNFDRVMSDDQLALSSIGQLFETTAMETAMVAAVRELGGGRRVPYWVEICTHCGGRSSRFSSYWKRVFTMR